MGPYGEGETNYFTPPFHREGGNILWRGVEVNKKLNKYKSIDDDLVITLKKLFIKK
jgi:hypothetical protein